MNGRSRIWLGVVVATILTLGAGWAWSVSRRAPGQLSARVAAVAPAPPDVTGYARAQGPKPLVFPADSGPHDDYQTEWWYYTGNLAGPNGEHFGYQLTFFRRALLPPGQRVSRASDFGATQAYMAHLALTDVAGGQHYSYERLERGAAGLAGAVSNPYRVWLDDWSVAASADGVLRLTARDGPIALRLELHDLKGPVLQGDRGYSQKGPEPGNASYYYSLTRIATRGEVTVRGQAFAVEGLSWMDHEYSTSALSQGQVGWDWFSLQLSGDRELMLFQIRRSDGTIDPFSGGTLVEPDGKTRRLTRNDFRVQATGQWRSPRTGATYPSSWRLSVPAASLELTIEPYLADQEMSGSYTYWEGAVHVEGSLAGQPVSGSGYVELTGYAGSMGGQF